MASSAAPAFVGRSRELATLEALLAHARAGRPSLALVVGEPGIGKTRTVQALGRSASSTGAHVHWATCFENDPRPFAPWVQIVDEVVAAGDAVELAERLGAAAATAATVVPSLGEALPDVAVPATLAPTEARFRIYDSLARLVAAAAHRDPTLVILEDLHWADAASLELLAYVARTLEEEKLLLVGTARDVALEHPLGHALADAERTLTVHRVRLSALEDEAIALLIEDLVGYAPSSRVVKAIAEETAGNPFFAAALVRHLADDGHDLAADVVPTAIPGSVRDAVGRRLARLSPQTVEMLSVACAFSGPFGFEELRALTGLDDESLLAALDEALEATMLRPAEGDRYEFGHAIVRDALYEASSPSRRSRLHRRVAQALEQAHAGSEREHAAELATQYHRSRSSPGAAHGIAYAVTAADAARERFAYESAAELLRMACDLAADGSASVRADLLSRLAVVEAEALLVERSRRTVDDAVDALREASAAEPAISAFLADAAWALQEAGAPPASTQPLVERGLALAGGRRYLVWARLKLAEYPLETFRVDGVVGGRWLGFDPHAVQIARTEGDERDYAKTIELMDWRSRAEVEELLTTVETWTDAAAKIHGLSIVVRSLLIQHGDVLASQAAAQKLLDLSTDVGSIPGQAYAVAYLAHAAEALGDFGRRDADSARARELIVRLGPGHRLHSGIGSRRPRSWFVDLDFAESGHAFWSYACDPSSPPWMGLVHAAVAAEFLALAGAADESRRILEIVVPPIVDSEPTTLNQNGAVAAAISAAWELAEPAPAAALKKCVVDLRAAGVGDQAGTFSSLDVAGGRAAALMGERAEAHSFFADARERLEARGLRPLRAIVDFDEARALLRWGESGALPLVEVATRQFEALGMTYWRERADALKAQIEDPYPDRLTRREVEVLRRIAAGDSNKEVAAALFLSVHTVERHVANVYRKIGARNRAEAAAYATRLRLEDT